MRWGKVKLEDIVSFRGGGTPRKDILEYWESEIPWATVKDFKSLEIRDTQDKISKKGLDASSSNLIPAGHVIIPTRMALGKAAINIIDVAINQDLKALIPKGKVDTRYLLYSMLGLSERIKENGSGATVKGITQTKLSRFEIPFPPLPEQKRIAAILDAAEALRAKRRQTLKELETFLQATFLHMFGDPVTNPMGWNMGVVGDLLESVNYGTSKKASADKKQYPVIRMGNMTYSGELDFSDLKYMDLSDKEKPKHLAYKNQILFNRTNSKELVGKTAVYRNDEPMAFAGYLIRGVANHSASPEYIAAFMNTPQMKNYLRNKCKNIVGMANINAKEFQSIPVQKPPLALQQQFAAIVESVERQKVAMKAHLAELDDLFGSLQQRAFNGEL